MTKKLVEVYKAKSEGEAQVIKGMLEAFGIPSLLQSNVAPSIHVFTVDGLGYVKVMVNIEQAEEAKRLIDEGSQPVPNSD